jgi:GxxExxY protein
MTENELSKVVFDAGTRVHKALGPGLLESAYEECLFYELQKQGLSVEKQKALPLIYEEVRLDAGCAFFVFFVVKNIISMVKTLFSLKDHQNRFIMSV